MASIKRIWSGETKVFRFSVQGVQDASQFTDVIVTISPLTGKKVVGVYSTSNGKLSYDTVTKTYVFLMSSNETLKFKGDYTLQCKIVVKDVVQIFEICTLSFLSNFVGTYGVFPETEGLTVDLVIEQMIASVGGVSKDYVDNLISEVYSSQEELEQRLQFLIDEGLEYKLDKSSFIPQDDIESIIN